MYLKLLLFSLMFKIDLFLGDYVNLPDCGVSKKDWDINSRIVGGTKVNITNFPWTVSFQKKLKEQGESEHFCGGSIINERWLLSAAHCFKGVRHSLKKVRAVVGSTQWNGTSGATYEVDKLFMHEKYDSFNYANDIALIKTKTTIKFKSDANYFHINAICLAKPNLPLPESAHVYGWGLLGEFASNSINLMKTNLDKVDLKKCNEAYKDYIGKFTKEMMCYSAPGKDACQGDSGGPLSHHIKGIEYQIGIVSYGLGCGRPENPGIYTNVVPYQHWIKKTITDN